MPISAPTSPSSAGAVLRNPPGPFVSQKNLIRPSSSRSSSSGSGGDGGRNTKKAKRSSGVTKEPYPSVPPIYSLLHSLTPIVAPFLPPQILAAYPAAIQTLLPALDPVDAHLRELLPRTQNWTHDFLTALLLSGRWTLATDVKIGFLLEKLVGDVSREEAAARVLWAVGQWRKRGYGGGHRDEVGWQTEGLLAGFHVPGRECDDIQLAHGELGEAVVWAGGRAWVVQVFRDGEVLDVDEIQAQVESVADAVAGRERAEISVAALSHRLPRELWARAKSSLEDEPRTKESMRRLYSSLTTVALDDYPLPQPTAQALDDIRGNVHSPNRFADQTLGFVVYSDARVGMTVDHTVADNKAGLETALWLASLASAAETPLTPSPFTAPTTELSFPALITRPLLPLPIAPRPGEPDLFMPFPKSAPLPRTYHDSVPRDVRSTTLRLPRELHTRRHVDAALQMALQAATGRDTPITQAVFQRGVANARSEPVMMVTDAGVAFVESLEDPTLTGADRQRAFFTAVEARKERIKTRTFPFYRNLFLHPSLSVLHPSQELQTILTVLHVASGGDNSVQLSGFTIDDTGGVEAALANIVNEHQLGVFYLGRIADGGECDGEVEVAFCAAGDMWRHELEDVVQCFEAVWEMILDAAAGREAWVGVM